jgi:uncharacterized FlaG/YvyC family protein
MDIAPVQKTEAVTAPVATPADPRTAAANRELVRAVKALNAAELPGTNRELTFLMDRATQRPIIRLKDKLTGDVIRQIPPEYVLRLAEEMRANSAP